MKAGVALDNAHIGNAANGKSTLVNSQSAGVADGQNTAAKNARKAPGVAIAFGALQRNLAMAKRAPASDIIDTAVIACTARITTIIDCPAALCLERVDLSFG